MRTLVMRRALTLVTAALLIGLVGGSAKATVVYAVSDQLVDSFDAEFQLSGSIGIDPTTGQVDAANLSVAGPAFNFTNVTDQFVDSTHDGADVLFVDVAGDELQLDIITGTSNGSFPGTFSGGSVLAGVDTFFFWPAANDTFTPFGAGTVTGPELSPPPANSVPEPVSLVLLGTGLVGLGVASRRRP